MPAPCAGNGHVEGTLAELLSRTKSRDPRLPVPSPATRLVSQSQLGREIRRHPRRADPARGLPLRERLLVAVRASYVSARFKWALGCPQSNSTALPKVRIASSKRPANRYVVPSPLSTGIDRGSSSSAFWSSAIDSSCRPLEARKLPYQ